MDQFRWQKWAACKGAPSYIFFADEKPPRNDPHKGKTFKDYCGDCPVRTKCGEFANLHDMLGVWGGRTEKERHNASCGEDREELREYKGDTGEYWPLYGHS